MKLPDEIRERFRRYGRAGGRTRAAGMSRASRTAIARRASMARWLRHRFGSSSFEAMGFPGGDVVDAGLTDLADGKTTEASLLVSLAATRLRREGVPLGTVHAEPEDLLFQLLTKTSGDLAHARYGAYVRQMASFADACRRVRLDRR